MTTPRLDDRRLQHLIATMGDQLEDVIEKGGRDIEAAAKSIVIEKDIIDTGATLNSIDSRRVAGDRFARAIGPTTDYAIHLELGTHRMPARPFMTPAMEMNRKPINDAILGVFERA